MSLEKVMGAGNLYMDMITDEFLLRTTSMKAAAASALFNFCERNFNASALPTCDQLRTDLESALLQPESIETFIQHVIDGFSASKPA